MFLSEIFEDRKGLPDLHLAVGKRRHLAGAGDFGHPRFEILGIERNHLFVESDARDLHGNPWAQRPRGIVLVADDEFERHPSSRDVLRARSLGQRGREGDISRHRSLAAPPTMVGAAHRRGQVPPRPARPVTIDSEPRSQRRDIR
jgi:hypothetical protein